MGILRRLRQKRMRLTHPATGEKAGMSRLAGPVFVRGTVVSTFCEKLFFPDFEKTGKQVKDRASLLNSRANRSVQYKPFKNDRKVESVLPLPVPGIAGCPDDFPAREQAAAH